MESRRAAVNVLLLVAVSGLVALPRTAESLQAEASLRRTAPLEILDLAPEHAVRVRVHRPVLAWWEADPSSSTFLPEGTTELPVPAARPYVLAWERDEGSGRLPWDATETLRAAAARLAAGPIPGGELVGQEQVLEGDAPLLVGPSPRDLLESWRRELLHALPHPERTRQVFGGLDEWATLEVRSGRVPAPPCAPPAVEPWDYGRSTESSLGRPPGAVTVPTGQQDLTAAGLIHDAALGAVLPPPGVLRRRFFLYWPETSPTGQGNLRIVLGVRGVDHRWLRFQEMKVNGDGFRATLPPAGCGARGERVAVVLEPEAEPDPGILLQLEVWAPPEAPLEGELVEAWLERVPGSRG